MTLMRHHRCRLAMIANGSLGLGQVILMILRRLVGLVKLRSLVLLMSVRGLMILVIFARKNALGRRG